jgi:hypothetical protein
LLSASVIVLKFDASVLRVCRVRRIIDETTDRTLIFARSYATQYVLSLNDKS